MTERKGLRWWPAVLILVVAAAVLGWVGVLDHAPGAMSKPSLVILTATLSTLLLLGWWLLLSRAPWWARLVGQSCCSLPARHVY